MQIVARASVMFVFLFIVMRTMGRKELAELSAFELILLGWLRHKLFNTSFLRSFVSVTLGGAIIASLSAALGVFAAG